MATADASDSAISTTTRSHLANSQAPFWYSNAIFFVGIHIGAIYGAYKYPIWDTPRPTRVLTFACWLVAELGVTIGYHRLYSHRSFTATLPLRAVLALCGALGFQGSIKWWVLRHRLHHRFTDDPVHDPYAATRGLFFSHVGWIFFKPNYQKLKYIDKEDLEEDPVVQFQHKYYIIIALMSGFVIPTCLGVLWNDPWGSYVWAGLVCRLLVWHCTFCVNSLAHWDGLQPYSDENTSRGNLLLAMITCGEGNHNFHHAFPHDFRSGPSVLAWDPSKWLILILHRFGLVTSLRRARKEELVEALRYMHTKAHHHHEQFLSSEPDSDWDGANWSKEHLIEFCQNNPLKTLILVDGYVIDVSPYLEEHPGGSRVLRRYKILPGKIPDASWAFNGGLNHHSRSARRQMKRCRVARLA